MQDAKEEVRARLAIEDVVGEYVELKRAGRNFKGLSPFSGEKTPSFFVSPEKQIWHDFSSNKGGDIFSFVMEVEGLDFRGALEHLARKANVDLSLFQNVKSRGLAEKKKRLHAATELAVRYYQHCLLQNKHALDYVFGKRKIDKSTAEAFRIGYAPDSGDVLVRFLISKGFTKKELADAGLTNRFGGDLFRGRMMVPLMDGGGLPIGFTGRILTEDKNAPKYLNTPQTLLYDKSRHVFGLSQAKEAIRTHDYAVVVEGNMDVVSSWQAGVRHTVATAGTAMTPHHLRALSRLSQRVRLAFDGDNAGLAATERAIPIAQEVGAELSIISLPDGAKDPDELIQQGVALWQAAIDTAKPVVDWVLDQHARRNNLSTAAGKRAYTTATLAVVRHVSDQVEQEHYLQAVAEKSGSSLEVLRAKMASSGTPAQSPRMKQVKQQTESVGRDVFDYQDDLLALCLVEGSNGLLLGIDTDCFAGERRQAVARYSAAHPEQMTDTPRELQKYDDYVKILLLRADARYAGWTHDEKRHQTERLLQRTVKEHKKQQKTLLTERLRDAQELGDDDQARSLLEQIQLINKEINS